jgi:choline-sulfatase
VKAALGLLLLLLASCERPEPPASQIAPLASTPPAPVVTAAARDAGDDAASQTPRGPFNVLLIVIDSLRADVQWQGYRRPNAPRLTAFAKQAVVYRQAYSISSTTARSIAPLLAGRYPSEMVRSGEYFTRYYPDNVFLSELVEQAGAHTLAVHAHAYFVRASGMAQGFKDYHILPGTRLNDPEPKPSAERTTAAARSLIARAASTSERGFFAYVQYLDPHAPYLQHDDRPVFGDAPRDRYDQEVHYTDDWVGSLISWVKSRPWGERTAIIVTADHGECFGEHGQLKHGYELWQELVHVPLLIQVPGAEPRVIDMARSQIDLARTVLELMSVPAAPGMRGQSLVPELFGAEPAPRPIVVDLPRDNLQDRRRALIEGDTKLIARGDDERWLLYDLGRDPRERRNLAELEPARLRRMQRRYFELSRQIGLEEVRGNTPLANAPAGRRW